ncbi:UDP-glucose 4-epimerase family protein [Methylophaga sp.]|uniref:UDP-glucose 4-epimerase family protein n=1 Tax=Methylophaga sp. TaxID=2024840 RepID=UPI003A91F2AF
MKVLLTGATGFVGKTLLSELKLNNHTCIAAVRNYSPHLPKDIKQVVTGGLSPDQNWLTALAGIDVVIHLAARVHVMDDNAIEPMRLYKHTNADSTLNLAQQAADAGVKRFIFLSTIKVNGEYSLADSPFQEFVEHSPLDPYAASKWMAEQSLIRIARDSEMEVTIIRPPLVYGPGVKGNFSSMMKWLDKGLPLPLGAVHNKRSLIAVDNLVDFILLCMTHPQAANETFVIADGEDVSISELLVRLGDVMNKKLWLFPVPVSFMELIAKILGKQHVAQRLFGCLEVDISKAREVVGWRPAVSMVKQLNKMIK